MRRDRTTMTRDDIDSGRLVCSVAIASMEPAEFAVIGKRNDRGPRAWQQATASVPCAAGDFAREIDRRRPRRRAGHEVVSGEGVAEYADLGRGYTTRGSTLCEALRTPRVKQVGL